MKVRTIIILVLTLVVVSFFAGRYSTSHVRSAQYDEISQLTDVMTVYKREISGHEYTIYEKTQIIASKNEAIGAGIIDRDHLRVLNLKGVRQITKINAEFSAYKDSVDLSGDSVVFVTDTIIGSGEVKNYVSLPFSWNYEDDYLTLSTGIRNNKQAWFDLSAQLPITITLGGRDGRQVAAVSTPSPYIVINDFNVVNLREIHWKDHWSLPAGLGVLGGVTAGFLIWGL